MEEPATTKPTEPTPAEEKHLSSHTYEDDLARAMDTTDATVVQAMLEEAREREANQKEEVIRKKQKGWYTVAAIILAFFALGTAGYGIYHYQTLTVPVQESFSVGVFPQTKEVVLGTTDIRTLVADFEADQTLEKGKPFLIQLIKDETTKVPLTKQELFTFFESKATEPFLASFGILRMGIMNTGEKNVPFIIGSVTDSEITSKELLIAEPELLRMLYKPLNIELAEHSEDIGKTFSQQYIYNLPTRGLSLGGENNAPHTVLFYGYATEKIVVFSTDYSVLKAVYDSILSQQ